MNKASEQWRMSCSIDALKARAALNQQIRAFFAEKEVLEVETPILSNAAACDPNLDSFQTSLLQQDKNLYAHTSPEFAMKRILASGSGSLYQIAKVFRQGERGRLHNPEFTLLEWYRVGFSYIQLLEELIALLMVCLNQNIHFQTVKYGDLFKSITQINPHQTSVHELNAYAIEQGYIGVERIVQGRLENALDFVFSECIQPQLKPNVITAVIEYPSCLAMLSKLSSTGTAKRFEVYYQGVELANGYEELTCVNEQSERFMEENKVRKALGQPCMPIDTRFLASLKSGLPDCSGVAVGLDRLLMLILGAHHIDDVIAFPIEKA